MEDSQIVALYWKRDEQAIVQTQSKYGKYCHCIASNILPVYEDAQECVNDTYLAAWNSIPPHRPTALSTFLGKLTRRISLDRWRSTQAKKRGGGTVPLVLDELGECIPGGSDPAAQVEARELALAVGRFLDTLTDSQRRLFLLRYFRLDSVPQAAEQCRLSVSKAKSVLHRLRKQLRTYLQKEGY